MKPSNSILASTVISSAPAFPVAVQLTVPSSFLPNFSGEVMVTGSGFPFWRMTNSIGCDRMSLGSLPMEVISSVK